MKYLALCIFLLPLYLHAQECDSAISKGWPAAGYRHAGRYVHVAGRPARGLLTVEITGRHLYLKSDYSPDTSVINLGQCASPVSVMYHFRFRNGKDVEYVVPEYRMYNDGCGEMWGNTRTPTLFFSDRNIDPNYASFKPRGNAPYWLSGGQRPGYDSVLYWFRNEALERVSYRVLTIELHTIKRPSRFVYYLMYPKIKHDINRYKRTHADYGLDIHGPYGSYIIKEENRKYVEEYNLLLSVDDADWLKCTLNCVKL